MATFRIKTGVCTVMLHETILEQNSVAILLRHCFEWLQHCSSIATLCCAKNRRCESSHVTSPLHKPENSISKKVRERKLLGVFSEFFFSFWTSGIQFQAGIIAMKIEKSRIHFFSGRFCRLRRCTHSSDLEFMNSRREKSLLATS